MLNCCNIGIKSNKEFKIEKEKKNRLGCTLSEKF